MAQIGTVNVDLGGGDGTQVATLAEATIGPDGQIILTGEDGTQSSECDSRLPPVTDACAQPFLSQGWLRSPSPCTRQS